MHVFMFFVLLVSLSNTAILSNYTILLSRVLVTETGFGFVFGFIDHLQVVTAINYHTVPTFDATNHSTLSLS
jgi:hypothetical protein